MKFPTLWNLMECFQATCSWIARKEGVVKEQHRNDGILPKRIEDKLAWRQETHWQTHLKSLSYLDFEALQSQQTSNWSRASCKFFDNPNVHVPIAIVPRIEIEQLKNLQHSQLAALPFLKNMTHQTNSSPPFFQLGPYIYTDKWTRYWTWYPSDNAAWSPETPTPTCASWIIGTSSGATPRILGNRSLMRIFYWQKNTSEGCVANWSPMTVKSKLRFFIIVCFETLFYSKTAFL